MASGDEARSVGASNPVRPRATLKLPAARSGSVLEALRSESSSRVARVYFDDANPVEVGIASDVLYVPALHLQVWRERVLPVEANADDDAFREIELASRNGEIMAHAIFANVQHWHEDVCVLSNLYAHNFYHFIEELYKVIILERAGFTGRYLFSTFPSRMAQEAPRFSFEFLDLLGIERHRIAYVGRPSVLRSAWFTTRVGHADALRYPGVFCALRNALRAVAAGPFLGERLWLERRTSRLLVNETEVHDCLREHGFTILDMSDLPVSQQIAAAMRAEVLAGPHGAALIHSMFLKERSTVIECFSPLHVNFHILEILAALEHRYMQLVPPHMVTAPYRHHGAVAVNCLHLRLVLRQLAGRD